MAELFGQRSAVVWLLLALAGYLVGCVNGAILISKLFYHDDVRKHGSGNAGLTNFYRTYGKKHALLVIAADMLKAVVAALLGALLLGSPLGKYYMGFFCMLGHMFPAPYQFKGGKGILCSGTLLLCLDWRIALAGWGAFLLMVVLTKYVSLGSICAAASFPISTAAVYHNRPLRPAEFSSVLALSLLISGLVIWAHRENIKRLLRGTENKFHWKKE